MPHTMTADDKANLKVQLLASQPAEYFVEFAELIQIWANLAAVFPIMAGVVCC